MNTNPIKEFEYCRHCIYSVFVSEGRHIWLDLFTCENYKSDLYQIVFTAHKEACDLFSPKGGTNERM